MRYETALKDFALTLQQFDSKRVNQSRQATAGSELRSNTVHFCTAGYFEQNANGSHKFFHGSGVIGSAALPAVSLSQRWARPL